jgi:hypothetical protein
MVGGWIGLMIVLIPIGLLVLAWVHFDPEMMLQFVSFVGWLFLFFSPFILDLFMAFLPEDMVGFLPADGDELQMIAGVWRQRFVHFGQLR